MKKIFYFIASAIVALGAVACQNDIDENLVPEQNDNVVSFSVEFDEATRINFNTDSENKKVTFTFETSDKLYLQTTSGNTYTFSTTDGTNFSCENAQLVKDLATNTTVYIYSREEKKKDSSLGKEGILFYFNGTLSDTVTLACQGAIFQFVVPEGKQVTLSAGINCFIVENEFTNTVTYSAGEYFAEASNGTYDLSYSIGGVTAKSISGKQWKSHTIYNLGTLQAPSASLRGINGDWNNGINMFAEGDYIVAKNVKVSSDCAFKIIYNDWLGGSEAAVTGVWKSLSSSGGNISIAAGNYDIYMTKNGERYVVMTAGSSVTSPTSTHKIYVEDDSDYSTLYVSIYQGEKHVVTWPGVQAVNTETINNVEYKVVEFEAYVNETYEILFNNNKGSQVPGVDVVWNGDKYYRVTKKYTEVISTPNSYEGKDDPNTIYVKVNDKENHTSPAAIKCYIYKTSNSSVNNTWPGKAMTKMSGKAKINNTYYWYYEPETKYANTNVTVMLNESGWQTSDEHKKSRNFTGDLYYDFYADNYSYIANANAPTL